MKENFKIYYTLALDFKKENSNSNDSVRHYIVSNVFTIHNEEQINENYNIMTNKILNQVEDYKNRGSGLIINNILMLIVNIGKYVPNRGNKYIELRPWLKNKKCIINPKNLNDNICFKWAFIAEMHYKEIKSHSERIENLKPYENLHYFSMLNYPVSFDNRI